MLPNQTWYCSIVLSLVPSVAFSSIYFIVFMTFESFYSIIQPHRAASVNTTKKDKVIIMCTVVLGFLYYSPPWFFSENIDRQCIYNNNFIHSKHGSLYYWLTISIRFVLHFVSLMRMNIVIIHTLRKRSQWMIARPQGHGQSQGQNIKQVLKDKSTSLCF